MEKGAAMMPTANDALTELPSEPLCLQFADTTGNYRGTSAYDLVSDIEGLIEWCKRAGIVSPAQARACRLDARRRPDAARRVHERALALRRSIHGIGAALALGRSPAADDIATLNSVLQQALSHTILSPGRPSRWSFDEGGNRLERLLWPIARSAADLFTSTNAEKLVQCAGQTCDWLFLDQTKNRSRRFCTSAGCGNRDRVARFYERRRTASRR